jgi:hypothetical protein
MRRILLCQLSFCIRERIVWRLVERVTLRVRTRHDLGEILAESESPAWRIAKRREALIARVHVVSFDGRQRIEGLFDREGSQRREDGRLIVRFSNARIVACDVRFDSRNPVRYVEDD